MAPGSRRRIAGAVLSLAVHLGVGGSLFYRWSGTTPDTTPPPSIQDGKETFEGLLLARIQQVRRYPEDALRQRREGIVHVRFCMNRKGRVLDANIVGSSGVRQLDREALDTIGRAQPLPEIPQDRPDVMVVTVPIEFFLTNGRRFARASLSER